MSDLWKMVEEDQNDGIYIAWQVDAVCVRFCLSDEMEIGHNRSRVKSSTGTECVEYVI